MPCDVDYSGMNLGTLRSSITVAPEMLPQLDAQLKEHAKCLEGVLCAIFTELEKLDNADAFIKVAAEKSGVDVGKWWANHKGIDKERLKNDLSKYSEHELSIIKQLINHA